MVKSAQRGTGWMPVSPARICDQRQCCTLGSEILFTPSNHVESSIESCRVVSLCFLSSCARIWEDKKNGISPKHVLT